MIIVYLSVVNSVGLTDITIHAKLAISFLDSILNLYDMTGDPQFP
jgi:hypothetical protein